METLSRNLKLLRKSMNLTQKELGLKLACSESMVSYLEKGNRGFSIKHLKPISILFGVTIDFLIYAKEQEVRDWIVSNHIPIEKQSNKPMSKQIEGIKSKCCNARVCKYYDRRSPGNEEQFLCEACDEICEFYEVKEKTPQPNNDWEGREEIAKVIYSKELKNPLKVLEIEAIIKKEKEKSYLEGQQQTIKDVGEWIEEHTHCTEISGVEIELLEKDNLQTYLSNLSK